MGVEECGSYAQASNDYFSLLVYQCDDDHGISLFLT